MEKFHKIVAKSKHLAMYHRLSGMKKRKFMQDYVSDKLSKLLTPELIEL